MVSWCPWGEGKSDPQDQASRLELASLVRRGRAKISDSLGFPLLDTKYIISYYLNTEIPSNLPEHSALCKTPSIFALPEVGQREEMILTNFINGIIFEKNGEVGIRYNLNLEKR